MGCWNETCGITGTPIAFQDPVVRVRLAREPSWKEVWERILTLDRGTYNDYGGLMEGPDYDLFEFAPSSAGFTIDLRDADLSILFHRGVWERVVQAFPCTELPWSLRFREVIGVTQYHWDDFRQAHRDYAEKYRTDELQRRAQWAVQQGKDPVAHNAGIPPFSEEVFAQCWQAAVDKLPPRAVPLTPDQLQEICAVWAFCRATRRDPLSTEEFRGQQAYGERAQYHLLTTELRRYARQFYRK